MNHAITRAITGKRERSKVLVGKMENSLPACIGCWLNSTSTHRSTPFFLVLHASFVANANLLSAIYINIIVYTKFGCYIFFFVLSMRARALLADQRERVKDDDVGVSGFHTIFTAMPTRARDRI